MSVYKRFKTSESCERDGVWLDYGDGVRVRVARAGGSNRRFLKAMERFRRKHKRRIDLDLLDEDVARPAVIDIFAETVVLGWEGVANEEGTPLECTKENVVKVFTDLPDFFDAVRDDAARAEIFRAHIDEEDAKNS